MFIKMISFIGKTVDFRLRQEVTLSLHECLSYQIEFLNLAKTADWLMWVVRRLITTSTTDNNNFEIARAVCPLHSNWNWLRHAHNNDVCTMHRWLEHHHHQLSQYSRT